MSDIKFRFVLRPASIVSAKDDDLHYVSYSELVRLYGLEHNQCVDGTHNDYRYKGVLDIILCPRDSGDYQEYLEHRIKIRLATMDMGDYGKLVHKSQGSTWEDK